MKLILLHHRYNELPVPGDVISEDSEYQTSFCTIKKGGLVDARGSLHEPDQRHISSATNCDMMRATLS
jgi:hypothetical protein